jgi:CDP-6-deoxy-D-xylo-4-hexulose-3-dehydrase
MPRSIHLAEDTITKSELAELSEWMLAGNRLTKSRETVLFEEEFANWMGSRYAVFVNSGSSANLLMIYALKELGRVKNMRAIAPAVSWVTTVSPFLQFGFDTKLCDCDRETLGLDLNHLEALCREHTPSVLILVHVLGHSNNVSEIKQICDKYGVIILEDSCEALGSEYRGAKLGTLGTAGSFSFYYGHHISTIEGGMVVTDDYELYQVMLSLRSHGWSRDLAPEKREALTTAHSVDAFRNLYTFYHAGFNLRSTDLQARLGRSQLKKLGAIVKAREQNFLEYRSGLQDFFVQTSEADPLSSFAYGTFVQNRLEVYEHLKVNEIECRPLICGNIARHPFWLTVNGPEKLPNADTVHDFGIYLPNHHNLTSTDIDRVARVFLDVARPKN